MIRFESVTHPYNLITRKCTTLWGEPDRIHIQNSYIPMTHLNLRPQKIRNIHVYTGTVSQDWL